MPTVTLSSKNQITLPAELVRVLGLKAGDKLSVIQSGDHLALFPQLAEFADYVVGSMKGFWGSKEEIDRYIAEERASWTGEDDKEALDDALAADSELRAVYEALPASRHEGCGYSDLAKRSAVKGGALDEKLDKLKRLAAIREVPLPEPPAIGDQSVYRRLR